MYNFAEQNDLVLRVRIQELTLANDILEERVNDCDEKIERLCGVIGEMHQFVRQTHVLIGAILENKSPEVLRSILEHKYAEIEENMKEITDQSSN